MQLQYYSPKISHREKTVTNIFRVTILTLLCFYLCAANSTAESPAPDKEPNQPAYLKTIPPDKLKEDLDFLFKTIEEVHPNMHAYISKEEFAKSRAQLYKQIDSPMNSRQLYQLVAPTVALLKNGHTYICPFSLTGNDKVFPIGLRWDGQDVIVEDSYAGNVLPLGGKVLTINGKDARDVIHKLARYFPDEYKERNLREIERPEFLWVWLWLEYGNAEPLDLRVKSVDGTVKNYALKAVPLEQVKKPSRYEKMGNYTYRYMPEYGTGLIELNQFVDMKAFKKFLETTFKKIKEQKVSGLIIDIRRNDGGNSQLADALVRYLTGKPYCLFKEAQVKLSKQFCRQSKAQVTDEMIGTIFTEKGRLKQHGFNPLKFNGQTFLLISPICLSTSACFAAAIKHYEIGKLIGEETGGTTKVYGYCLKFEMPNSGLQMAVACSYYIYPGSKPDGRGVIPDYEVKQKPEDTAKGVDTVLQFTLNLIEDPNSAVQQELSKEPNLPDYAKSIPPEKLKEDLDFLFKTIEEVHPNMYAYTSKEEFGPLREQLYKDVNRSMTRLEFFKLTAPAVAAVKNSHTALQPFTQEFTSYFKGDGKVFPLELRWYGSKVILSKDYSSASLPVGGEVLTINGRSVGEIVASFSCLFAAENRSTNSQLITENTNVLRLWLWLEYGPVESWDLKIRSNDGKVNSYTIKSVTATELECHEATANLASKYSYQYFPKYDTSLLEINSFGGFEGDLRGFKEFLSESFRKIRKQKVTNLIIDVRENEGGHDNRVSQLMGYLTAKPYRMYEKGEIKI